MTATNGDQDTSASNTFSRSWGWLTIRRYFYVFVASFVGYFTALIILDTDTLIVVRSMALYPLPWLLVGGLVFWFRRGEQDLDNSQNSIRQKNGL